jgi:argininosuccinate synthase
VRTLDPDLEIIAPLRDWEFKTREEEIEYAKERRIPIDVTQKSPYSIDKNIWGIAIEAGILEDAWVEPPEDAYVMTCSAAKAPAKPKYLVIEFVKGVPVKVNGVRKGLVEMIEYLNTVAGQYGVGRFDVIENRLVGIKSREVYEVAGALALITAHRELEDLVLTRDLIHFKRTIEAKLADMIYEGQWFDPLTEACKAFLFSTQERVSGTIRLRFFKGTCAAEGRRSANTLYNYKLATYSKEDEFSHTAAAGFTELWGLPIEMWARVGKEIALEASE